jgi:apolipoprotein N-acyltransferase
MVDPFDPFPIKVGVPAHVRAFRAVGRGARRCGNAVAGRVSRMRAAVPPRLSQMALAFSPRLSRTAGAIAAGLMLCASFPPIGWWWAAALAFALIGWVLTDEATTPRRGLGYGLLFGLAFYIPLLPWISSLVGVVPWLALATLEALFPAGFCALAVVVRRLPAWPVWFAAGWAAQEAVKSAVPFGGFPWGVVAFSQAGGPLLPLARMGGTALLSFAVALTGFSLAELTIQTVRWWRAGRLSAPGRPAAPPAVLVPTALICVVLFATTLIWPQVRHSGVGAGNEPLVTVAAVQGNVPRLGLDFNAQRRAVLDNHVMETERLAEDVRARRALQPMFVIWPEDASDIDPIANPDAATQIEVAIGEIHTPILVGTLLAGPGNTPDHPVATNTAIVWDPVKGPVDRHDKRIVQPFGEYLPLRGFFTHLTSYADRAGYFVPGHGSGVVHIAGVPLGVTTCWEVIFDRAARQSVLNGAQLLAVPSNNATFDQPMSEQQLAFGKVRAVEHDRYVVVVGTTGISAVIAPDGRELARTKWFEPAYLDQQIRLKTQLTPATKWGPNLRWLLIGIAVAALLMAMRHNGWFVLSKADDRPDRRGQHQRQRSHMTAGRPSERTLVIIPTFNERENLPLILRRVNTATPDAHVLIVDDNSPDGTGALADQLSLADPDRVHVMHRTAKNGLGAAYLAGFGWGLSREYSVLVEMDADGSHAPEQLRRLLDAVDAGADLVIGSRYVEGGAVRNWPRRRLALSRGANTYSRLLLGVNIHDITAGYRAYRREVLEKIDLAAVESRGYCFQIDLTWRTINAGFSVAEVPITFSERELGVSKMSGSNIREAMIKVAQWGIRGRLNRARGIPG